MAERLTQLTLCDDPESTIRFVETAMGDTEWRADIHIPAWQREDKTKLAELHSNLQRHGFIIEVAQDADGHQTWHLHHPEHDTDVGQFFRDHGLIKGTAHVIQNPLGSTKSLLQGTYEGIQHAANWAKDPAHLNGLTFTTAELFLLAAAGGNPHGKWHHPKNLAQGAAAGMFLSQSLAYLFLARRGDTQIADHFTQQFNKLQQDNDAPLEITNGEAKKPATGILGKTREFLEAYPIQVGAALNNAGMLTYIGHTLMEREYRKGFTDAKSIEYVKHGYKKGIAGCMVSILGWSSMLLTPKEYEEKSSNGFTRLYQHIRENPQYIGGAAGTVSSSFRLVEALGKGNKIQAIGEGIYIPGDLMLFFIKNHDYGTSHNGSFELLVDKIADVILASPVFYDAAAREELYAQTAGFILNQHEAMNKDAPFTDDERREKQTELTTGLRERCEPALSLRFDDFTEKARQLMEMRPELNASALSQALLKWPEIRADATLLSKELARGMGDAFPCPRLPDSFEKGIGELALAVNPKQAGNRVVTLVQALSPCESKTHDTDKMPKALLDSASVTSLGRQQQASSVLQPSS